VVRQVSPNANAMTDAEAIEQPRQHVAAAVRRWYRANSRPKAGPDALCTLVEEVDGRAGVVVEREQRPVARLGKAALDQRVEPVGAGVEVAAKHGLGRVRENR